MKSSVLAGVMSIWDMLAGWLAGCQTDDSGLTVRGLKIGILLMETASPVFEAGVRTYLDFIHMH